MKPDLFQLMALLFYVVASALAFSGIKSKTSPKTRWQLGAVVIAVFLQTVGIAFYCARSTTHYFTSLWEISILLSWAIGCGYLIMLALWSMQSLGVVILPMISIVLGISHLLPRIGPVPTGDSSKDSLFTIHIMSAFLGYALYLIACAASAIYLQRGRMLKRKSFSPFSHNLPSLEKLEKAETLGVWAGLFLFSVALGTGARLANRHVEVDWYLEPKILATQMTWLIFLILAIGRSSGRLAGRATAKVILVSALLVLFTFVLRHPFKGPAAQTSSHVSENGTGPLSSGGEARP